MAEHVPVEIIDDDKERLDDGGDKKGLLIEFVREHEALWDPAHKDYMNRDMKTILFTEIGRQLGWNGRLKKTLP